MKTFEDMSDWRAARAALDSATLGFVPTMGALHAGHRSLVEASVADNSLTVVSVYVNATQFDRASDLAAYPVDTAGDLALLRKWGAGVVLLPRYEEIYADDYRYRVSESELSSKFCGAHRPGHFDGVLTVVLRLLNLVRPDRAYFGEKDWQQLELVRGMVDAFFMNVAIVACPTVREADGLALSSRNRRLSAPERDRAPALYRALVDSPAAGVAADTLRREGFNVDYVEDFQGRRLAAARLGGIRLIDNVALERTRD